MISPGEIRDAHRELCDRMAALTTAIEAFKPTDQQHSPQMREWEPFLVMDAATCVAGVATVGVSGSDLKPAVVGWEAKLSRVSISITGASSAATGAVFRRGADPTNMIDRIATFAATVIGTVTYYTNTSEFNTPAYFWGGDGLVVTISGAGSTEQVIVRAEGYRRQI